MLPDDWPEWLPADWTVHIRTMDDRKVKCYVDPEGHRFYSKPQVERHLKSLNKTTVSEKNNGGGSAVDLSLQPDVPNTSEVPQLTPRTRGRPRKPTTGISSNTSKGQEFSTELDKSQKHEATESNHTPEKTEGVRMSTADYELISSTPADGLPPGWMEEIRMRKDGKKDPYYQDPLSGYIFFSKLDALSYLESGSVKKCAMRPLRKDTNGDIINTNLAGGEFGSPSDLSKRSETSELSPNNSAMESKAKESGTTDKRKVRSITEDGNLSTPDASRKSEVSEWLPDGWVVEVNVRDNGSKIKYFMESATGRKFYSKPQVLNYLGYVNSSNSRKRKGDRSYPEDQAGSPSSGPSDVNHHQGSIKKKGGILNVDFTEVVTASPAEGLPPGWIREMRTRQYATHERTDPFYIDPVTGYMFRSKLDALRFLETGNINLCAIRPKKKDVMENEVGGRSYPEDQSWSTSSGPSDVKHHQGSIKKKVAILNGDYTEVATASPAEGLPPGWIREMRTRKYATHERTDPFYIDPSTGYIFRSKLDALRFLETGNVDSCAMRPKKKDADGNEVSVYGPEGKKTPSRKPLFKGKQQNTISTDPTTQILEENHVTNPETAANTSASGRVTRAQTAKHNKPSTPLPARTSGRLKAVKPDTKSSHPLPNARVDNGIVQEKHVSGVNVEKQADEDQLSYHLEEDPNWTDQCIDFAVRTLTSDILAGDMPANVRDGNDRLETGRNEARTKVN